MKYRSPSYNNVCLYVRILNRYIPPPRTSVSTATDTQSTHSQQSPGPHMQMIKKFNSDRVAHPEPSKTLKALSKSPRN